MIAEGGRTTVRIEFLAVLDGAHLERHDLTDIPPFSLAIIIATNSAQASKSSETSLLVPEAGLHRDGEQARLVNLVRRRQLEQCRHDYEAMSTIQWINDSLWKFWTSVIVTDKVDEKIQFQLHFCVQPPDMCSKLCKRLMQRARKQSKLSQSFPLLTAFH